MFCFPKSWDLNNNRNNKNTKNKENKKNENKDNNNTKNKKNHNKNKDKKNNKNNNMTSIITITITIQWRNFGIFLVCRVWVMPWDPTQSQHYLKKLNREWTMRALFFDVAASNYI